MSNMEIGFISDIHLDFYVKPSLTGHKEEKAIEKFIDNELNLPESDILIIAGDTSHYNNQIVLLLQKILEKVQYDKIFITYGNHELYLISDKQESKYKTSKDKIIELKDLCNAIPNVHFLDGNVIEYRGIKIGGTAMWYDFSYGKKIFNLPKDKILEKWKDVMTDSTRIHGTDFIGIEEPKIYTYKKIKKYTFDPLKFFYEEYDKMMKIIEECDIFVSHVGPAVPTNLKPEYQNIDTSFYFFDGEHILNKDKAPKLWFFGHTHENYYFKINQTQLLCNPKGYKSEKLGNAVEIIDF